MIGGGVSYAMSILDKDNSECLRLRKYTEEYTNNSSKIGVGIGRLLF